MGGQEIRIECPNCGKLVVRGQQQDTPYFPFCSRRCRMVDLGKWFDEEHRISEEAPPRAEGPQ